MKEIQPDVTKDNNKQLISQYHNDKMMMMIMIMMIASKTLKLEIQRYTTGNGNSGVLQDLSRGLALWSPLSCSNLLQLLQFLFHLNDTSLFLFL